MKPEELAEALKAFDYACLDCKEICDSDADTDEQVSIILGDYFKEYERAILGSLKLLHKIMSEMPPKRQDDDYGYAAHVGEIIGFNEFRTWLTNILEMENGN